MFKEINQSGRSMIEMLGVLAIIGVLSVGGIAGYSKAMTKFKINKTMQQITEIATNIRTLYAQQKDFNGLNNTMAIQMGIIPDELATGSGTSYSYKGPVQKISHAFGGDIFITDDITDDGFEDSSFGIELTNLTKESCIALASADWGTTDSSGVIGIIIGYASDPGSHIYTSTSNLNSSCGTVTLDNQYATCPNSTKPISPAIAASVCEQIPNFGIRFRK